MIWAFMAGGKNPKIVFVPTTLNSEGYQKMLEEHLLPLKQQFGRKKWQFQQDNAPCHASRSSMKWFGDKNIDVLPWPSRSPDLNPIENIWGYLSRQIYANNKQYSTVAELKQEVIDA